VGHRLLLLPQMNLLANLSPSYRGSLITGDPAGAHATGKHAPFIEMMNTLEKLKQNDPRLYHRVQREALACLRSKVRKADAAVDIRLMAGRRHGGRLHKIASLLQRLWPIAA
jgi:hypothetical protein